MYSKKRRNYSSPFDTIPNYLLEDILIRIDDPKTVFRCMSVCKQWHSVIMYLRRSNKTRKSDRFTLLFQWHVNAAVNPDFPVPIVHEAENNARTTILDFMPHKNNMDVVASCHDLVLVQNFGLGPLYYVVNPLIHQWIPVVACPTHIPYPNSIVANTSYKAGFLWQYDNESCVDSNLVFKIIRISHVCCIPPLEELYDLDTAKLRVQIFSSDTNTWNEYVVRWYSFRLTQFLNDVPIISYDGMFHWLNGNFLLSLNPFDLKLNNGKLTINRIIKLPVEIYDFNRGYHLNILMGFGVSQGYLRVMTKCPSMTIWQLHETKIGDASVTSSRDMWCKVYNVVNDIHLNYNYDLHVSLQFLAFHPNEGDVIYVQEGDSVIKLNLRTRARVEFKQHKPTCWLRTRVAPPLPPLVHPWFPTELIRLPLQFLSSA